MPHTWDPSSLAPEQALVRLVEGNRRFRQETQAGWRPRWVQGPIAQAQRPFAIVLGCSDSRTPVEILFDQGFGDLFVVRVAGNVVAPSIVGSIEFAASQFGTRLVVVMGHSQCGAVAATIHALETGLGPESKNIRSITDRIAPHIESLVKGGGGDPDAFQRAVRANIKASADHLRHGSSLLEELVIGKRLEVVGAEYDLDTGQVDFFDRPA